MSVRLEAECGPDGGARSIAPTPDRPLNGSREFVTCSPLPSVLGEVCLVFFGKPLIRHCPSTQESERAAYFIVVIRELLVQELIIVRDLEVDFLFFLPLDQAISSIDHDRLLMQSLSTSTVLGERANVEINEGEESVQEAEQSPKLPDQGCYQCDDRIRAGCD